MQRYDDDLLGDAAGPMRRPACRHLDDDPANPGVQVLHVTWVCLALMALAAVVPAFLSWFWPTH